MQGLAAIVAVFIGIINHHHQNHLYFQDNSEKDWDMAKPGC